MVVEQPHRVEAEGLSTGYEGPLPALLGAWHSEATTTFQAKPRHLAGLEARALWLKQVVTESELSKPHALQRLGFQDFVPVHTRLQFEQSARKGGARYSRIPDSRFPPAASRASRSCGVATKPGPLAEAEACAGGGEAQSRRSRRARLWAPGGGVRATRVRGRLGARRHPPGPSVCLPTNCHRSAATHSDALNKRPAQAICFPLLRAQAAWSPAHRRDPQSANTATPGDAYLPSQQLSAAWSQPFHPPVVHPQELETGKDWFQNKGSKQKKLLQQNSGEQEEDFLGRPPPCLPAPQIFHPSGVYSRQAPCLPVAMAMASEPGISSPDVRLLPQML
ncbi:homeobox protein DLX-4 [Alexandromys fortis]|uniref:homeobox protein DLX-4 n=1 Tax=Alexandromys fortis TaxID=100897 RepID=UPI002152632D|nr:homeobox protein DLX-4 [Microtus fortis]